MIVVDTNVLAYFWLPSDHSEICDQLFQKSSEWFAPVLWKSEFRNVVTLYLRKGLIDLTDAMHITEKAEIQMKDRQFHVNTVQVYHLVEKSDCSSYDCEFVSLAIDLNAQLVTMDRQILRSFPDTAITPSDFLS